MNRFSKPVDKVGQESNVFHMNDAVRESGNCTFIKSSCCTYPPGGCVEVARKGDLVFVRDAKNPNQPCLVFSTPEWHAFIKGAKAGEFDFR